MTKDFLWAANANDDGWSIRELLAAMRNEFGDLRLAAGKLRVQFADGEILRVKTRNPLYRGLVEALPSRHLSNPCAEISLDRTPDPSAWARFERELRRLRLAFVSYDGQRDLVNIRFVGSARPESSQRRIYRDLAAGVVRISGLFNTGGTSVRVDFGSRSPLFSYIEQVSNAPSDSVSEPQSVTYTHTSPNGAVAVVLHVPATVANYGGRLEVTYTLAVAERLRKIVDEALGDSVDVRDNVVVVHFESST